MALGVPLKLIIVEVPPQIEVVPDMVAVGTGKTVKSNVLTGVYVSPLLTEPLPSVSQ